MKGLAKKVNRSNKDTVKPVVPEIPGASGNPYVFTAASILELENLPRFLVVAGGGYNALELASLYASFGSEVVVLESGDRLLKEEDHDISRDVQWLLEKKGVAFHFNAQAEAIENDKAATRVIYRGKKGQEYRIPCDAVLYAPGRDPYTGDFSFYCMYIDPPLAHTGLHEYEAKEKGLRFRVNRVPVASVMAAKTMGDTDGVMKAIIEKETNRILGCTLLCPQAEELINILDITIQTGKNSDQLRDIKYTPFSMFEAFNQLFK